MVFSTSKIKRLAYLVLSAVWTIFLILVVALWCHSYWANLIFFAARITMTSVSGPSGHTSGLSDGITCAFGMGRVTLHYKRTSNQSSNQPNARNSVSTLWLRDLVRKTPADYPLYMPRDTFFRRMGFGYATVHTGVQIPSSSSVAFEDSNTIGTPLWFLALMLTVLAWTSIRGWIKSHRQVKATQQQNLCPSCGYDLCATQSSTCPECGKPASLPPLP